MAGGGGGGASRNYFVKKGGHLLFTWSAGERAYRNFDLSNILERSIMTSPLRCLLFSFAVSGKSTKSTVKVKELDQASTESRSPWIPVEAVLDS